MQNTSHKELRKIQSHEWHLWYLALILILFFGGLTITTFFFIGNNFFSEVGISKSNANKALWGLSILIILFCAYILRTRVTLGKMYGVIQTQANHDDLTKLYNRRYFSTRIEEEINRAERDGYKLALLYCDFDKFKVVNDSLGYQQGDAILKAAAENIQKCARGTDLVFRWGGEEIMIILLGTSREGIMIAGERFRSGIQKLGSQHQIDLDMSIGVALSPEQGRAPDQLIGIAERALYIAKKGGDKIHIGDEEYHLDEKTVQLVFQSIVNVSSNKVLGYEALGRDPQGKLTILELFKKYQTIGQLTQLKCICFKSTMRLAQEIGLERVFINISFKVLSNLQIEPIPPSLDVVLEISEAEVLHDINNHLETVKLWRDNGYKFAIDDFGAGFISLPFIARLVPDYIKLDRSTVLHAVTSSQFREFLKSLIQALKMYTTEGMIAEGVETEEELGVVKELGIEVVQGFLLGKPEKLN